MELVAEGRLRGVVAAVGWRARPAIQSRSPPGFLPDGDGDALGRPAGLAVGADGALYVSDDKAGSIYRIARSAASNPAGPHLTTEPARRPVLEYGRVLAHNPTPRNGSRFADARLSNAGRTPCDDHVPRRDLPAHTGCSRSTIPTAR